MNSDVRAAHTRIIEAVAKEPATDSEQEIESALRDHLLITTDVIPSAFAVGVGRA